MKTDERDLYLQKKSKNKTAKYKDARINKFMNQEKKEYVAYQASA